MDMSGSLETRKQKKARSAGRGEAGRLPRAGARNAGVGRSDRFGLFGGLGFAGLALAPARFLLIAAETMLGRGFAKTFLRRSGLGGLAWQRRKRVIGLCRDRKSVVLGKSVSVRVDLGGCRFITK